MFKFSYELSDLFLYKEQLTASLCVADDGDLLCYPEHIASGYSRFCRINDYISFQVVNYTARQQLVFERLPSTQHNLIISFQNFAFTPNEDGEGINNTYTINRNIGSVCCRDSSLGETIVIPAFADIRVILVYCSEDWIDRTIRKEEDKIRLKQYMLPQPAQIRKVFLSPSQRTLLDEISSPDTDRPLQHMYMESRVLMLLEEFLNEVLNQDEADSSFSVSEQDIQSLQKAEAFLLENFEQPFPGISQLCRISCLSRTKLINTFRMVYGNTPYGYFQKKRMQIAHDLILTQKETITGVAHLLGYKNTGNFSIAFKKEFGILPSEMPG